MFTLLKYIVIVTAVSTLILLSYPLGLFVYSALRDPGCLKIEIPVVESIDRDVVRLVFNITYCSPVRLRDFTMYIGETRVYVGDVVRGVKTVEVFIERSHVEAGLKRVEFSIEGLYKMVMRYERKP